MRFILSSPFYFKVIFFFLAGFFCKLRHTPIISPIDRIKHCYCILYDHQTCHLSIIIYLGYLLIEHLLCTRYLLRSYIGPNDKQSCSSGFRWPVRFWSDKDQHIPMETNAKDHRRKPSYQVPCWEPAFSLQHAPLHGPIPDIPPGPGFWTITQRQDSRKASRPSSLSFFFWNLSTISQKGCCQV